MKREDCTVCNKQHSQRIQFTYLYKQSMYSTKVSKLSICEHRSGYPSPLKTNGPDPISVVYDDTLNLLHNKPVTLSIAGTCTGNAEGNRFVVEEV